MDDPRERVQDAGARAEATDDITTADGAVRELEKNAEVARADAERDADAPAEESADPEWNTVISLGKDGSGAPEEDAADAEEVSGIAPTPGRA